jgi:transposase
LASTSDKPDYDQLAAENDDLKNRLGELEHQLDWFKRQLFGERSEKRVGVDEASGQQRLGLGDTPAPEQAQHPTETITYTRRQGKDRGAAVNDAGLRFDDDVPQRLIDLPAAADGEIIAIHTTCRLAQRPAAYEVLVYRQPVVKDPTKGTVTTTSAPANVFEGSCFDVSLVAGVLVDKFGFHLPLYRQHQRLTQAGIQVARASLTNVVERAAALLTPIAEAQLGNALSGQVLAMDETPIKAGRKSKGRMQQAYFWPVYGEVDEVCFTYSRTRGKAHIERLLGERFSGTLLTDGYAAYAKYASGKPAITHAQCWSHARRMFERARGSDPAADEALDQIAALYRIEQSLRDQDPEARHQARLEQAQPVVRAFWRWCDDQLRRNDLEPNHPLVKALGYVLERTGALEVFLGDPAVPIDTNHLERGLRPIPMGRRNWLFCWSEVGAEWVATIQSLLVTCRLQGVDPYTYLVDVLQRVGDHPASEVIELTPRRWKERFADQPLRSDVDRASAPAG